MDRDAMGKRLRGEEVPLDAWRVLRPPLPTSLRQRILSDRIPMTWPARASFARFAGDGGDRERELERTELLARAAHQLGVGQQQTQNDLRLDEAFWKSVSIQRSPSYSRTVPSRT